MCGIIGIVSPGCGEREKDAVAAGVRTLTKRGPDAEGITSFSGAILGHRRLSIIDLAGGGQPMKDVSGTLAITFNGEIYNYKEVRSELQKKGVVFKTKSDTEVILEAYKVYGERCVEHLDGMFAFAIWDESRQQLFLARDRFGEKPLYYFHQGKSFAFASEIKALLSANIIKPELDPTSLDNYLTLGYVPPWRSIYADVAPLPPAHYAVYKNGSLTKTCFWKLRHKQNDIPFDDAARRVRALFEQAVKSRMVADVEVGSLLSGGIDSGLVTLLAASTVPAKTLKTFSIGFGSAINELPHAEDLARRADTDHHSRQADIKIADMLRETMTYFDEPFADSSCIPTQLLSKLVRQKVPVALSGDGGDELFFGYGHYRRGWHLPLKERIKRIFAQPFANVPLHLATSFSPSERLGLLRDKAAVETDIAKYLDLSEAQTDLQKINLIDYQLTLPGDILTKVDRSSMMHSLEVRSPFLQHELAEFAYNLPDHYKTNPERGKLVLAAAFSDLMPESFFMRKKQGFGAPIKEWLKNSSVSPLVARLKEPSARINEVLHTGAVRSLVEAYQNGNDRLARRIWVLLTLEMWMQTRSG